MYAPGSTAGLFRTACVMPAAASSVAAKLSRTMMPLLLCEPDGGSIRQGGGWAEGQGRSKGKEKEEEGE